MGILLKDEEINSIVGELKITKVINAPITREEAEILANALMIAIKATNKVQLKKVVEFIDWLDNGTRSSASWRHEVRKFKQALLKEVK